MKRYQRWFGVFLFGLVVVGLGLLFLNVPSRLRADQSVQPPSVAAAAGSKPDYVVRMAELDTKTMVAVKLQVREGTTWFLSNNQWVNVPEPAPLALGLYDIVLRTKTNMTSDQWNWQALRIEGTSGNTWFLTETTAGSCSWKAVAQQ